MYDAQLSGLGYRQSRGPRHFVWMMSRTGHLKGSAAALGDRRGEERARGLDSSAVYGVVRARAGLGFESGVVKERDGGQ